MSKVLSFADFIELARIHYNEGGDGVYECWDKLSYDFYVKEFGPITKEKALSIFNLYKNLETEYY